MTISPISFAIPGSDVDGTAVLARPDSDQPSPGVIVLHEAFGLNPDIERITSRFADNGYVAMAPDFFGPGFRLRCIVNAFRDMRKQSGPTFERIDAARAWLAARPDVDENRIGVVGFCMGGGFAVLHAAKSEIHVVAAYYGDAPKSAEALRGSPPCFAGYGERDKALFPQAKVLKRHYDELNIPIELATYPDAGHSYMSKQDTTLARLGKYTPLHAQYDPTAAEASWTRMLAFFKEHFGE